MGVGFQNSCQGQSQGPSRLSTWARLLLLVTTSCFANPCPNKLAFLQSDGSSICVFVCFRSSLRIIHMKPKKERSRTNRSCRSHRNRLCVHCKFLIIMAGSPMKGAGDCDHALFSTSLWLHDMYIYIDIIDTYTSLSCW